MDRPPPDKSTWGAGPWQSEPDEVRWIDEATNLPCWIRRSPVTGSLNGYVGVPRSHPAFGLPASFYHFDFDPEAEPIDWTDIANPRTAFEREALKRMAERHHKQQLEHWQAVKDRIPIQHFVNDLRCHGGLTWANQWDDSSPDWWWFGFDCGHAGDVAPAMNAIKDRLGFPRIAVESMLRRETYRTVAYVTEECTQLARQIADIAITVNGDTRWTNADAKESYGE
jgi:hypothetical protein